MNCNFEVSAMKLIEFNKSYSLCTNIFYGPSIKIFFSNSYVEVIFNVTVIFPSCKVYFLILMSSVYGGAWNRNFYTWIIKNLVKKIMWLDKVNLLDRCTLKATCEKFQNIYVFMNWVTRWLFQLSKVIPVFVILQVSNFSKVCNLFLFSWFRWIYSLNTSLG